MPKPVMSFDQFAEIWLRVDTEMKKTQGHSFVGVGMLARCQWCRRRPMPNDPCPHWMNTFCAFLALELTGNFSIPDYGRTIIVPGGNS